MSKVLCYSGINPSLIQQPYYVAAARNLHGRISTSTVISPGGRFVNDAQIYRSSLDYHPLSVIDMPYGGKSTNSQGWLRSINYFNRALYEQAPKAFSTDNLKRLEARKSLIVDNQMAAVFPQYQDFKGQKLKHHHIGGDGQVVGVPEVLHIGNGGVYNVEKNTGITESAQAFSNYYCKTIREHPGLSWDNIVSSFLAQQAGIQQQVTGDFSSRASLLISKDNYDQFISGNPGVLGHNGQQFVAPSREIDALLKEGNNDLRTMEEKLGLAEGALGNKGIYHMLHNEARELLV